MPDLIVICGPRPAPGYRLAGTRTLVAESPEQATDLVLRLVEGDGERGVIAVAAPLWAAMSPRLRLRLESMTVPLVTGLPPDTEADPAAGRRAGLQALLAQAVGYEFTFTPHEDTP